MNDEVMGLKTPFRHVPCRLKVADVESPSRVEPTDSTAQRLVDCSLGMGTSDAERGSVEPELWRVLLAYGVVALYRLGAYL